jgi:hypothetical protein
MTTSSFPDTRSLRVRERRGTHGTLACRWTAGIVTLWGAVAVGCGAQNADRLAVFPVDGQVTLDGQPLANALVILHPRDASDPRALAARGQTDASGKFKVTTYEAGDGAPPGEYAVTVAYHQPIGQGTNWEPGPNILPAKYALPETTDLSARVAAGPTTLPVITLRR